MTKKRNINVNNLLATLLLEEPFFASFSRYVDKKPSKEVPTAGVRYNAVRRRFEMVYNQDFFSTLSNQEIKEVIKHELYHIALGHVSGRGPGDRSVSKTHGEKTDPLQQEEKESLSPEEIFEREYEKNKDHIIWNIATDAEINCYLPNLPRNENFQPIKVGEGIFENVPERKGSDWYSQHIYATKPPKKLLMRKSDSHDGWGICSKTGEPLNEVDRIIAERVLRSAIREAARQAAASGWGNTPEQFRKYIESLLSRQIDWKRALRYFVAKSQRAERRTTYRRVNRRVPYGYPGTTRQRHARILIGIDQSGSVSDSLLGAFFSELAGLSDHASFDYVYFDTEVSETVHHWKRGEKNPPHRERCGGTDFGPISLFAEEENYDGLIIMTDMQASAPPRIRPQRMWVTTVQDAENKPFETDDYIAAIDLSQ